MDFHPDLAPAMRNTHEKNHDSLARARLMARDPAGERDWAERYAERFGDLYKTNDDFRDLVCEELTEENLTRIQEQLDRA